MSYETTFLYKKVFENVQDYIENPLKWDSPAQDDFRDLLLEYGSACRNETRAQIGRKLYTEKEIT